MKKQDLLKHLDNELLEKLFGFCYARTRDSYEAEELCSDILFALVKTANTEGEIENVYSFIWRTARNVYADFSEKRRKETEQNYQGNPEDILTLIVDSDACDDDSTKSSLMAIYRRIAFLTKAYREVMILFYLEGLSTAEIAKRQKVSESAIRQRLFSAREKIKSEVATMSNKNNKPVSLDNINFNLIGTGSPRWGNPSSCCTRMFSKHVVWLCHQKPRLASEIAEELNVPTVYVEEELELLRLGVNQKYGMLRRLDNGRYAINFVLLDEETFEAATNIYIDQIPNICSILASYIENHKEEYLAFPYLNRKVDFNLILWQQIYRMSLTFAVCVHQKLKEKHFSHLSLTDRPFTLFGHVDTGKHYGCGCDGANAQNVCGYSNVHFENIYIKRIKQHFACGHNISTDPMMQLPIRAISGIDVNSLTEEEKEHAAKAIEMGYLYREGDTLYTKILVNDFSSNDQLFSITQQLQNGYFDKDAEKVAQRIAELIKKKLPDYLQNEWNFANGIASLPLIDLIVENMIARGILIPPENKLGAEGCWLSVQK